MTRHQKVEMMAYFLWEHRGRPFGSPEVDWFRAERQLAIQDSDDREATMIVATAKKVGSALGKLTGVVEAVVER